MIERPSKPRLRLLVLIGIALALVLIGFAVDVPARVSHLFILRALQRHDFAAAEAWLDRSRLLSSRNPRTELIAARIARRQGQMDEMTKYLKRAIAVGAERGAVRLEELLALAHADQLDGIEEELVARLAEPDSEADEISDAYANGLAAVSRFGDARSVLAAWSEDFPRDPRPDYRLGRLHEYFHLWEDAEASYHRALQRNADYHPARYRLGRVLFTQRRVDEAMTEFLTCLSMPNPLAARVQLAACYRALGKPDQARDLLRNVLEHDRETLDASYRSVEEFPEHFEAATQLGDLESEAGNHEQALHWLQLAVAENPRDLVARYALAVTLRQLGRSEQAEREFDRVLVARKALERANPLRDRIAKRADDLEARLELGEILLAHESQKMGLFWLRSILTYDADYLPAHQALARYYREQAALSSQYAPLAAYHEQAADRLQTSIP